ncbi:MAG: hypothetical protein ACREJ0_24215, partial [Geminicoccaceae bacterium]
MFIVPSPRADPDCRAALPSTMNAARSPIQVKRHSQPAHGLSRPTNARSGSGSVRPHPAVDSPVDALRQLFLF